MAEREAFRFVPVLRGMSVKRKQGTRACEHCRKHKRRCVHIGTEPSSSPKRRIDQGTPDQARRTPSRRPPVADNSSESNDEVNETRYVGDLNPEGAFLDMVRDEAGASATHADKIGVWLPPARAKEWKKLVASNRGSRFSSIYTATSTNATDFLAQIEEQCRKVMPPVADLNQLLEIYWAEMHPLFPILAKHEHTSFADDSQGRCLLNQAMCLAASASPRAKPFRRLDSVSESVCSRRTFARHLSLALQTPFNLGVVKDRLLSIQVGALLTLSTYFAGDGYLAADLCARTISSTHTLGLQLFVGGRENEARVETIFCCIWALDRLNAAFLGRPVMNHERDFGRNLERSVEKQEEGFRLFLSVIALLDGVIELYRPRPTKTSYPMPSFEALIYKTGSQNIKSSILASVEMLYHATSMLSARSPTSRVSLDTSESGVHQSLSAASVRALAKESLESLSYFPVIPYAVLLALRASYWQLRTSRVPMLVARARKDLLACCSLLRELSPCFWSVLPLAELAERTVREVEKVVSHAASQRQQLQPGLDNREDAGSPLASQNPSIAGQEQQNAMFNSTDYSQEAADEWDPGTFNSSTLYDLPDFNIFEHFDPNFDLEAIDAALGDNTFFDVTFGDDP